MKSCALEPSVIFPPRTVASLSSSLVFSPLQSAKLYHIPIYRDYIMSCGEFLAEWEKVPSGQGDSQLGDLALILARLPVDISE